MAPFSTQHEQLFFFLLLLLPIAINGAFFTGHQCLQNFTGNPILQGNINSTVLNLAANTYGRGGFANSSSGFGDEAIYGVVECRPDVTRQACSTCIAESAQEVLTSCPYSAEATIWQNSCVLSYGTNFKERKFNTRVSLWLSGNVTAGQAAFRRAVGRLNTALQAEAVSGESRKFSWGNIESLDGEGNTAVIYGMAQCIWVLSSAQCYDCLNGASTILTDACVNRPGCTVFNSGCLLKFEPERFLFLNAPFDRTIPATSMNITTL